MKKICFITTVDHNVGDDFVREGLKYLLTRCYENENIVFSNIHKHAPVTVRDGFEKIRKYKISQLLDFIMPILKKYDKILNADLVVQSGAPVYWCHTIGGGHCSNNEWYHPLIRKRLLRFNKKTPFLNIAAGSCQKYYSDGTEFCPKCKRYISELHRISAVTCVRDTLSKNILAQTGITTEVIPCTSIFAVDYYQIEKKEPEYIVMNYMVGGAHYSFGQEIDTVKWEKLFTSLYNYLKQNDTVILVCHDEKEVASALQIDHQANIFYAKNDYVAYMRFYSKAKFGIMNRVHGAFLMASFGTPSIVIGNDSRARMVNEIGLKSFFVNDVTIELLISEANYLSEGAENYCERFKIIKKKAFQMYMECLGHIR